MNEAKGLTIERGRWKLSTGLFDAIDSDPATAVGMAFGSEYSDDEILQSFLKEFKDLYLKSGLNPKCCAISESGWDVAASVVHLYSDKDNRMKFYGGLAENNTDLPTELSAYFFCPAFIRRLPSSEARRFVIAHEIAHEIRADHTTMREYLEKQASTTAPAAIDYISARRSRHCEWETDIGALQLIGDIEIWHTGLTQAMSTTARWFGKPSYKWHEAIVKATHPRSSCRSRLATRVYRHIKSLES